MTKTNAMPRSTSSLTSAGKLLAVLVMGCALCACSNNSVPLSFYGDGDSSAAVSFVRSLGDISEGDATYSPERADICDYDGDGKCEAAVYYTAEFYYVTVYNESGEVLFHDEYTDYPDPHGYYRTLCIDGENMLCYDWNNKGYIRLSAVYPEEIDVAEYHDGDETAMLFGEEISTDEFREFYSLNEEE